MYSSNIKYIYVTLKYISARKTKIYIYYIYKYLYSRRWDFRAQCRCVSSAANGSEKRVATAGADGLESPSRPRTHGGPNRNEFVFGGDPTHWDSPPPPAPGPVRRAAEASGSTPPRRVDQCANGFCFTWASSSGAPAPTHRRRRPPAS